MSPDPKKMCNSCCQGPTSFPGIPRSNGNHGKDGLVGPRGDVGSPGEVGEVGEPGDKGDKVSNKLVGEPAAKGDRGMKKEQGVGLPGKRELQGVPEPAGEKADAGECCSRRSAFSAVKNTDFTPPSPWDPLPFEKMVLSEEGTDFNLANGTLTCTVPGVYVFMFTVLKRASAYSLWVQLRKNSDVIVAGVVGVRGNHQVTGSAMISLNCGDQVHLAISGPVVSSPLHFTSFQGFLLHKT